MHARGFRETVGDGGDGKGCRDRDTREDECIVPCGAGSLPVQPSVGISVLLELEEKGAYRGCDSDCHCGWSRWSGVGMNKELKRGYSWALSGSNSGSSAVVLLK